MLRHTRPKIADGICYGQTDLDLTEPFEQEAEAVAIALPEIQQIFSSPLQRCRRLADYIAAKRRLSVTLDDRLAELNFGAWEGQAWDQIHRPDLEAWADDFYHACPHGGEAVADLKRRVDDAVRAVRPHSGNTLLVTHAGVVRAAFANGTNAEQFQTPIDFGQFIELPAHEDLNV
ncbi:MAG: alpha-ribazole phosphatase [Pseudomonadota bacterium]